HVHDIQITKPARIISTRRTELLSSHTMAFAENPTVKAFLERSGAESLPLILLDGEFVLSGRYPTRQDLVRWFGIVEEKAGRALVKSCGGGNTSCC
ncbi:arsenic metallochaperone ArsD family protein, partial [Klebsiella michiganensis]|uniref:arsenic metallochaperone ArsD family protein n=1 Tax=Klebsiella michiganensis TaxID=1134687 RepID=UPI00287DDD92